MTEWTEIMKRIDSVLWEAMNAGEILEYSINQVKNRYIFSFTVKPNDKL